MGMSEAEFDAKLARAVAKAMATKTAPTESSVDHVEHCPDCFAKAVRARSKTTDYVCNDCGLPLGNEEFVKKLPDCPNCGGTKPRKLDFNEKLMRMAKP